MKRFLQTLALIAVMMVPVVAGANELRGDVDGDGKVSINDVTSLINYLLRGNGAPAAADCDMDGRASINDVTTMINYLLSGNWPTTPSQEHEWVDLGLPSGTLWATCNIGADAPEDYGDYFAWGETEPKGAYDMNTYMWGYYDYDYYTEGVWHWKKYYYDYNDGLSTITGDNNTELDFDDDAAIVNWGPSWRMPTLEQIQELVSYCSWRWIQMNGVYGLLGIGSKSDTIFLPAAGYRMDGSLFSAGRAGHYWSCTLYPDYDGTAYSALACSLYFFPNYYYCDSQTRTLGIPVRAVYVP